MPTYDVNATRDGRFWMVAVPELDGLTQARYRGEVEAMAREYIATVLDLPVDDIAVRVAFG